MNINEKLHIVVTTIICLIVAGVAGWMFFPKQNEIRLVSPDGQSAVWITATNGGARIQVMSVNTSNDGMDGSNFILLEAPADGGASIGITTDREGLSGPSFSLSNSATAKAKRITITD